MNPHAHAPTITSPLNSAQLYAVCSAATRGSLVLATATSPRRVARAGCTVVYKVNVCRTKAKELGKTKAVGAAGPTLNLHVVLPTGVRYMKSSTTPLLRTHDAQGRKIKPQSVQADGRVLTWEDIGLNRRTVKVKVRVEPTVAPGTILTFSAQLFESVTVGAGSNPVPACPESAPDATVTVV